MEQKAQAETTTGLLEQAVLLVRPDSDHWRFLAESEEEIGFTQWQRHGWLWSELAIFEKDQAPLVCTIRRRLTWPFRREVRDAEGDLVGFLSPHTILDRWDRLLLSLVDHRFLNELGHEVARWSGERLELLPVIQHDPFLKMLIVAFVVSQ